MNAPDGGAHVLVGRGGYRAGVQDDEFGLYGSSGALQSAIEQLPLNRCAVGLRSAASEVLDMISRHLIIILSVVWRDLSLAWRVAAQGCTISLPSKQQLTFEMLHLKSRLCDGHNRSSGVSHEASYLAGR